MDLREFRMLETRCPVLLRRHFDPNKFLVNALDKHHLNQTQVDAIIQAVLSEDDTEDLSRIQNFIFELTKHIKFGQCLDILESLGFDHLAHGLRGNKCKLSKTSNGITQIIRISKQKEDSSFLIELFCKMKSVVDDRKQHDLQQYFRERTEGTLSVIKGQTNKIQKNRMADQLAIITWVRTQLYAKAEERERIVTYMRDKLCDLIDDMAFVDTVYYCKLACTAALRGNFEDAINKINEAEIHAERSKYTFAKTIVFHDRQFIYRKLNVSEKKSKNVEAIVDNCVKGLDSLTDPNSDQQVLLQRIFMLNMVQAMLGIGTYLEVDVEDQILNTKIMKVTDLLDEVERISKTQPMESRRELMFCVCRSRLAYAKSLPDEAFKQLNKATKLLKTGTIRKEEKQSVYDYHVKLQDKIFENQT